MFRSHNAWLPLLVGLLGLFVVVRALVTGKVHGRGLPIFFRETEPVAYWVTVGIMGLLTAALVWMALQ
jgi:hypothetical protein